MKKILILIILNSFIYSNFLKPFRITFPLPGMLTNTCRIEGTAKPFEVIKIFITDQILEKLVADKNGKWSCYPKFPLNKNDYKFKDTITVCNSENQSIQQEISIKIEPLELKLINKTGARLRMCSHPSFSELLNCNEELNFYLYHIDGDFYYNEKIIKDLIINLNGTYNVEYFLISELLKLYSEFQNFLNDYNNDKKTKLIQCINNIIPLDLLDIISDYAYLDENDFKSKTIRYYIILDESKIRLLDETEYNKLIKK